VAALWGALSFTSCKEEPHATDVEFSYTTFDCNEGADSDYVSLYLMYSPYKYPVVVDVDVEMTSGKNHLGKELTLDDVIEFDVTDKSYTVTKTGDRTAKIENVEITFSNYNQKISFKSHDNNYLQGETVTILITINKVEGSNLGSIKSATLTIVDDEKAPLVRVGYYDTTYDAPAEATSTHKGEFFMRLQKVGKYEYVASELFGLSRPRLLGIYDPEQNTITFDGTDYDHILWELKEPVNAFQNDTIWAANYNKQGVITQVLKFHGAGADGTEPIVMTTDQIEENKRGELRSIQNACGFDVYSFDAASSVATTKVGTYDAMQKSESMTFSDTNYPTETRATNPIEALPSPFGGWMINR
jgi:hypothetical protein